MFWRRKDNKQVIDALKWFAGLVTLNGEYKDGCGVLTPSRFVFNDNSYIYYKMSDILVERFDATHFSAYWENHKYNKIRIDLFRAEAFGACAGGKKVNSFVVKV